MAQMKMSTKISFGFAVVIILLLVVGGVSVFFLGKASADFTRYREWARDSNLMSNLQEDMLMVRMNVKDFLIRGDEKEKAEFDQYYEAVREIVATAQNQIQSEERAPIVDRIDEALIEYRGYFDEVVRLQGERDDEVIRGMDVLGPEIERDLTKILGSAREDEDMTASYFAGLAIRNLMLARLYAFKYLDSNETVHVQRVNKELEGLYENLDTLDRELQNLQRRNLLEEATGKSQQYESHFSAVVDIITERNDYVDNYLDVIGPQIAADGQTVVESIQADQDRLGPQVQRNNRTAILAAIIVSSAAFILGIVLAFFIIRGILRQLGADPAVIEEIAGRIALGDLEIEFDDDNIRGVYLSVKHMVDALRYKAGVLEEIANKNLGVDVKKASDKDGLGESLITMKRALNELLGQVNNAVEQVSNGADQVSQASQNLSQGATEQASSLEEITSSTHEINSQSKQNAETATEAHALAKKATEDATEGNGKMQLLTDIMERINASSDEINKVVKVIDDIAFQINLLALNANVEAARAGKYGKGFAVVADEVRNLAVKSADSVKETTAMVEETVSNIKEGSEAAEATAAQLGSIVEGSTKVADFLEEIAQASREQAQAIEQITEGLDQIDQATQASTASAEESASASEELAGQAQQLKGMVGQFRLDARLTSLSRDAGTHQRQISAPRAQTSSTGGGAHGSTHGGANSGEPGGNQAGSRGKSQQNETGIRPVNPDEVINLDDDDFDRF